ncbi:MAG: hypothetical protein U0359_01900 [Byssovorax sp.]
MTSAPDQPKRRSIPPPTAGFTPEVIAKVRDFATRKTLEQAHAFALGLSEVLRPGSEASDDELGEALSAIGIFRSDAEQIAVESLMLIQLVAERERRAEALEAAAAAAAERERSLYARLGSFARLLRLKLGPTSPALARFGIPIDPGLPPTVRARTLRPGPPDAPASK